MVYWLDSVYQPEQLDCVQSRTFGLTIRRDEDEKFPDSHGFLRRVITYDNPCFNKKNYIQNTYMLKF